MRFILINAIRDHGLEARRRRHPGQVVRRPVIGGVVLPVDARRVVVTSDLTAKYLREIEKHVGIGVCRFVQIGSSGPVSFSDLRRELKIPELELVPELEPAQESVVAGPFCRLSALEMEQLGQRLRVPRVVTNENLRGILGVLGVDGIGMRKSVLVEKILLHVGIHSRNASRDSGDMIDRVFELLSQAEA